VTWGDVEFELPTGRAGALSADAQFWVACDKGCWSRAAGSAGHRDGLKFLVSTAVVRHSGRMLIEPVRRSAPRQRYTHVTGVYRCSWPGSWFGQFKVRGRRFYVPTGRSHDEVAQRVDRTRAWVDHHLGRGVPIDVLAMVQRVVVFDPDECQSAGSSP
jgi:hypothetical protein